jgi:glycosyltransferase involved in cell wall biosynthesis
MNFEFKKYFKRAGANQAPVPISIIIPAHNEEAFLPVTLDALRKQKYPTFEVIVVANGCTDQTAEVAKGRCDQFYELRERGLGPARNLGAEKAKGDLLLFLDADTILEPDALQIIAAKFTRKYAAGTLKGEPDSMRLSYKLIYWLKNFVHQSHAHHGSSGVILCWKDHFNAVGGFDNELYLRENSDLMKKLRQFGCYKYIQATPAITSMRRYEKTGVREMILLWVRVWFLSNFSDIRNQTYEGMSTRPAMSSKFAQWVWNRLERKREEYRARRASVTY